MKLKEIIYVFPFSHIPPKADIVIWGMGNIGMQYLNQVRATGYCNVSYVVDSKGMELSSLHASVYKPDHITNHLNFDYIIIAIGNQNIADTVKENLRSIGIDKEKIIHDIQYYYEVRSVNDRWFSVYDDGFFMKLRKLLKVHHVKGKELVRIGGQYDGGYIMLDDLQEGRISYSFGIGNDVSWEDDIANRGIRVFMYDHTIQSLPKTRKEFVFFRKGIAGNKVGIEFGTLESFIVENKHETEMNMILKMDVEGAEWEFLSAVESTTLKKFDQIVMEIHGILDSSLHKRILDGIKKLNRTHNVIHIHANNYGWEWKTKGMVYSDVFEISWANKEVYEFEEEDVDLPRPIDMPCCDYIPEIRLGKWNRI